MRRQFHSLLMHVHTHVLLSSPTKQPQWFACCAVRLYYRNNYYFVRCSFTSYIIQTEYTLCLSWLLHCSLAILTCCMVLLYSSRAFRVRNMAEDLLLLRGILLSLWYLLRIRDETRDQTGARVNKLHGSSVIWKRESITKRNNNKKRNNTAACSCL